MFPAVSLKLPVAASADLESFEVEFLLDVGAPAGGAKLELPENEPMGIGIPPVGAYPS